MQIIPYEALSRYLDHLLGGLGTLLPEYLLVASLLFACLAQLGKGDWAAKLPYWITLIGFILSASLGGVMAQESHPHLYFFDSIQIDPIGRQSAILSDIAAILFLLMAPASGLWQKTSIRQRSDFYTLLPGIVLGIHIMCLATHWVTAVVALEMVSLGSYMLVAYLRHHRFLAEAGLKYILFGSVCSAMMLYGISWIYGLTGSLAFTNPLYLEGLYQADPTLAIVAHLLIFVGVGFKMAIFPFHWWSPDVLEGAPTPIAAFLATAPKIGGYVLLYRMVLPLHLEEVYGQRLVWVMGLWAVITLLVGNISALRQTNIKRLMAYSSIGHGGFLLMAILAQLYSSNSSIFLFYMLLYVLSTMGMFVWIAYIEQKYQVITIQAYKGLGTFSPYPFAAWAILLLSMIGLPPSGGFLAKVLVFAAGFESYQGSGQWMWLLLLMTGAICTVIALFYYLSIVRNAFLRKNDMLIAPNPSSGVKGLYVMGWVLALISLGLGIFPSLLE